MINIFYEPNYTKRKKTLFTLKFKQSIFLNKLIDFAYLFNLTIPDRYITNGPHKRMNNLIKSFKGKNNIVFNKFNYSNSYIVQFDWFGESVLNKLINEATEQKQVLIGPLYTDEQLINLSNYVKKHDYIKIVVASKFAYNKISQSNKFDINKNKLVIIPSGIISESKLKKHLIQKRNQKCLVYFKNRSQQELDKLLNLLDRKNISYDLFEYGMYDNQKLIKAAKKNKFGILLDGSESQGFAIQEIMACNLPLLVWNLEQKHEASSVPYFDNNCGEIVNSYEQLVSNIDKFLSKINLYNPHILIKEKLTYEKFFYNIMSEFKINKK